VPTPQPAQNTAMLAPVSAPVISTPLPLASPYGGGAGSTNVFSPAAPLTIGTGERALQWGAAALPGAVAVAVPGSDQSVSSTDSGAAAAPVDSGIPWWIWAAAAVAALLIFRK